MIKSIRTEREYMEANAAMRLLEPTTATPWSALRPEQRQELLHLSHLCAEYEMRTADRDAAGDYGRGYGWRCIL